MAGATRDSLDTEKAGIAHQASLPHIKSCVRPLTGGGATRGVVPFVPTVSFATSVWLALSV